jgi:hypothetical protein
MGTERTQASKKTHLIATTSMAHVNSHLSSLLVPDTVETPLCSLLLDLSSLLVHWDPEGTSHHHMPHPHSTNANSLEFRVDILQVPLERLAIQLFPQSNSAGYTAGHKHRIGKPTHS